MPLTPPAASGLKKGDSSCGLDSGESRLKVRDGSRVRPSCPSPQDAYTEVSDQQGPTGTVTNPRHLPWGARPPYSPAGPRDTFTEEHVPDTQDRRPRQGAGKDAHEPLGHVEHRVNALPAQVPVRQRGRPAQECEEDLSIQLNGLLWWSEPSEEPASLVWGGPEERDKKAGVGQGEALGGKAQLEPPACQHSPVLRCSNRGGTCHRSAPGTKTLAEKGDNKVWGGEFPDPAQHRPRPPGPPQLLTSAGMCMSSTAATGAWAWQ